MKKPLILILALAGAFVTIVVLDLLMLTVGLLTNFLNDHV